MNHNKRHLLFAEEPVVVLFINMYYEFMRARLEKFC